ncbi:class I SAM-dependent methyltransferase [Myxococcota bacterium]|nr:class I SAM-dependent methyltransferase [Myxococcota bacterium]
MSSEAIDKIIKSYRPGIIRLYSRIRFSILRQSFLEEIGQYLPERGKILDMGCGFGLFSLYFASVGSQRELVGVDLDRERVDCARASAGKLGLSNVRYECGDALQWQGREAFDAIYLLDLVHHLPSDDVPDFLQKLSSLLRPGGVMIVKDVSDRPVYKRWFTWILDRIMVSRDPIHYWPVTELTGLIEGLGFQVNWHRMNDFLPFPHVLYVCRRIGPDESSGDSQRGS